MGEINKDLVISYKDLSISELKSLLSRLPKSTLYTEKDKQLFEKLHSLDERKNEFKEKLTDIDNFEN